MRQPTEKFACKPHPGLKWRNYLISAPVIALEEHYPAGRVDPLTKGGKEDFRV